MCVFPMFFYGFPIFFVSRLFFERMGPLELKANEKPAKSIPRALKIDLRSTKIALRSSFWATSVDQVDRKCLFERSWVDLVGRNGPSERLSRRLGSILARSGSLSAGLVRRGAPNPPSPLTVIRIYIYIYIIYYILYILYIIYYIYYIYSILYILYILYIMRI